MVRAKFVLMSIQAHAYGDSKTYRFAPQYDTSIPEDQRFAQYSPSGELWIQVTNPVVHETWKLGESYYLDFTPVSIVGEGSDSSS